MIGKLAVTAHKHIVGYALSEDLHAKHISNNLLRLLQAAEWT